VLGRDGVGRAEPDNARLHRARKEVRVIWIRERREKPVLSVLEVLYDLACCEGVNGGGRTGIVLQVAQRNRDGQLDLCAFRGRASQGYSLGNAAT
jgi:hypothetical protein